MSKSYGNFIEIFEDVKPMKKKIMRIATDSRPMEEPKDPETDHLYQLFSLFADEPAKLEMASMYRAGGFGYGDVKKALAEVAVSYFAEAREKRAELESDMDKVHQNSRGWCCLRQGESRRSGQTRKRCLWCVKQMLETDRADKVLPVVGAMVNSFQALKISVRVLK